MIVDGKKHAKNHQSNIKRNYKYTLYCKKREIRKKRFNCLTPREHYPQKTTPPQTDS